MNVKTISILFCLLMFGQNFYAADGNINVDWRNLNNWAENLNNGRPEYQCGLPNKNAFVVIKPVDHRLGGYGWRWESKVIRNYDYSNPVITYHERLAEALEAFGAYYQQLQAE
jgi:hypothetical protein